MSDSNYASIGFVQEITWGETPANPTLKTVRLTKESLIRNKETVESQEVRSDRQISDLVEVGTDVAGGFEFELSYGFRDFIQSAMFAAVTVINFTETVEIETATQTITAGAGELSGVPIGATVKIAGAGTAGNNGFKLVIDRSADGSVLTFAAESFVLDEAAVDLTFTGTNMKNGIQRDSFTFERRILTIGGDAYFQTFIGQTIDTLALNFESKAIITGSFGFMGRKGESDADSIDAAVNSLVGYQDADTFPVMNATTNFSRFYFDNQKSEECLKNISLNIANGLRGKDCIGEIGNFDVGVGSFQVTGDLSGYFLNNDLYDRIISHADVAFSWTVTDPLGNSLVFTVPRAKISTGTPMIEGRNTDIMTTGSFTAILDPKTRATLIVDYHPAS